MEKLDICIQGQGHSKGSVCQWMFVQIIFSEPQNILLPNLVWWCSIMSQSVMWGKKIVFYLQGQGHIKCSYDQNMTLSTVSSELLIPCQPNLVCWYIIISQSVLWKKKDYCIQSRGHSKSSKCQWMFVIGCLVSMFHPVSWGWAAFWGRATLRSSEGNYWQDTVVYPKNMLTVWLNTV